MKNLILLLPLAFLIFSCDQGPDPEIENLRAENERLRTESIVKDSTLNSFLASYNEIEQNLAIIREREKLIRKEGTGDVSPDARKRITEDLTVIAELMEKNRQTISNLRSQLRSSDIKIAEFEKAVETLTKTIEEKDAEIVALSNQLAAMDVEIMRLSGEIKSISSDLSLREERIAKQDAELHKGYYVIGTRNELQDNGIITREGGFVGIGRTKTLSKDFNVKYFNEIDIRELKTIPINSRSAEIITSHPTNSYNLIGDRNIERLEITDHESFWRTSRHLVIVVR